ncbi:MAG: CvpA family protein [Planctomycetaceae bacterium]|jgi:uncharacterized membrane protein required for colicin V production|nr:CvpA family protein [Planctomycetaceae bacterium]
MSVFDLIIFAVLIAFAFRGWTTGMVAQIVSVGSLAVSWIVASRFAFLFAPSIPAEEPWNKIGAMIILFILTLFAVRQAHRYLEKKIKDWHLAKWNRHLGGLLGFLKGVIVCMVLTFFGVMLSEITRDVVFKSKSGNSLALLIEKTGTFIPPDSCELLRLQFERFNAKVNGNNVDGQETSGNLLPEEKSLQKMREFLSSGQEVRNIREETSSNLTNLISQGNSLLEQAQSFQQETEQAASLLDAIKKWWTGSGKENKNTATESTGKDQNPPTDSETAADKMTDKTADTTVFPPVSPFSRLVPETPEQPVRPFNPQNTANLSAEIIEKPLARSPASVNLSSVVSEEKTLFRRRFSENNRTTTEPLTTLSTAAPPTPTGAASDFGDSGSELPEVRALRIPVSRSPAPFRLRSSAVYSSERLLNSSTTPTPATRFVSPKR